MLKKFTLQFFTVLMLTPIGAMSMDFRKEEHTLSIIPPINLITTQPNPKVQVDLSQEVMKQTDQKHSTVVKDSLTLFDTLPLDLHRLICKHLFDEPLSYNQLSCKTVKFLWNISHTTQKIVIPYQDFLISKIISDQFNNFSPQIKPKDLRSFLQVISLGKKQEELEDLWGHKIPETLQDNPFIFISWVSPLHSYIISRPFIQTKFIQSDMSSSSLLVDILQEDRNYLLELYSIAFNQSLGNLDMQNDRYLPTLLTVFPTCDIYFSSDRIRVSAYKFLALLKQYFLTGSRYIDFAQGPSDKNLGGNYPIVIPDTYDDTEDKLKILLALNPDKQIIVRVGKEKSSYYQEGTLLDLTTLINSRGIKYLQLEDPWGCVSRVGKPFKGFLYECNNLASLNISGFINANSISNGFLSRCPNLTSVNISGLIHLTSIGKGFISKCPNLTSVDISGLINLTSIDNGFLSKCPNLTSVDISGLIHLASIGDYFLSECNNLPSFNGYDLIHLTSIDNGFLSKCPNLTSVDISGFINVKRIGNLFLSESNNLTSVDISSLINLTSIGDCFLSECNNLPFFNGYDLINLTSIGDGFLYKCPNLTSVDISGLINLTSIGDNCLSGCERLTSLDGSRLINVTSIGLFFLNNCPHLDKDMIREKILNVRKN